MPVVVATSRSYPLRCLHLHQQAHREAQAGHVRSDADVGGRDKQRWKWGGPRMPDQ